ncbi:MAG: DNA repair protein RecO [Gemmatimonadetes bacterium]|nr:DNA repair protein RecO [Gemmatimonadota bacterium]
MAPVSTPAIVLQTFKYGDTSKIVRLATRDFGVQSAIAKGASRPKSRFGGRLQSLSQGTAHLYIKQTRDLQTLAGFDLTAQRTELAADVGRYAAAAALSELVLRLSPAERHPEIFELLEQSLDRLVITPPADTGPLALAALWQMVSTLGFAPSLETCARDGRSLPAGAARFSVVDGGFLCSACAAGSEVSKLTAPDRAALERLVVGHPDVDLSAKQLAAHRRLLARFVRRHASEERALKALEFWEDGP